MVVSKTTFSKTQLSQKYLLPYLLFGMVKLIYVVLHTKLCYCLCFYLSLKLFYLLFSFSCLQKSLIRSWQYRRNHIEYVDKVASFKSGFAHNSLTRFGTFILKWTMARCVEKNHHVFGTLHWLHMYNKKGTIRGKSCASIQVLLKIAISQNIIISWS